MVVQHDPGPPVVATEPAPKRRPGGPKRTYSGHAVRVHLDGTLKNRLAKVRANDEERWVRGTTFEVLYLLAVALRGREDQTLSGPVVLKRDYNHTMSRAKWDLLERTGLDPALVVSDGHKGYRLDVPPENVTINPGTMAAYFPHLLAKAPWPE